MGVKSDVSWEQGDETGMSTMDWIVSWAHKPRRMPARRKRVGDRDARAARAGIVALSLALSLVGSHAPRAQERVMFRAGISDPVNTVLAWYVARDAGFYGANGLDVDIVNMNGGSRRAAELQAGHHDAMHVGLSSVIRVNRAGGEIRTIGSLSNVIRFT